MKPELRPIISAISAAIVTGRSPTTVYDHTRSAPFEVQVAVTQSGVIAYDHDRGAHLTGTLQNVYDHDAGHYVQLNKGDNRMSGYDLGSGHHFFVEFSGATAQFYDYEDGKYHAFTF